MTCTFDRPRQRRQRKRRVPTSDSTDLGRSPQTATSSSSAATDEVGERVAAVDIALLSTPDTPSFERISKISSRKAFSLMIQDYLDILYPLMPIVHRPSFKHDVANNRADHDQLFYSLLLCICAAVVCTLPRRFLEYRRAQWPFDFKTPYELTTHLERSVIDMRGQDYFEKSVVEKCAIAYFLGLAFGSVNLKGRATMYWAEMWVLLKAMGANDPDSYVGVSFTEAQLRKKAFWLYFIFAA